MLRPPLGLGCVVKFVDEMSPMASWAPGASVVLLSKLVCVMAFCVVGEVVCQPPPRPVKPAPFRLPVEERIE